jgi:hypothetical protein
VPLFEAAFARALELREFWLAGDAAHMVAIADERKMIEWTQRGLELADSELEAAYWAGPLLNNLRSRCGSATPRIHRRSSGRRKRSTRRARRSAPSPRDLSRSARARPRGASPRAPRI